MRVFREQKRLGGLGDCASILDGSRIMTADPAEVAKCFGFTFENVGVGFDIHNDTGTVMPDMEQSFPGLYHMYYDTLPAPNLSTVGAPVYSSLTDADPPPPYWAPRITHFDQKIFNPHFTDALNWTTGGNRVLNIGNPTSLYDPVEYLRSALIDSDWDRVAYWYAFYIKSMYAYTQNYGPEYYQISQLNMPNYKYVVNPNGTRTYYPMSSADFGAMIRNVIIPMRVTDLGRNQVAFGSFWPNGAQSYPINPKDMTLRQMWGNRAQNMDGGTNAPSSSPVGTARLGWTPSPPGPQFMDYLGPAMAGVVLGIVGGPALGAGISSLFAASAAPAITTAAVTGTAVASTATATVAGSVIGAGLEEVVITSAVTSLAAGSIIGGTVGAGLAAGAITPVATAPAISPATTSVPPAIPATPPLEEVIVSSAVAPVSTTSVAAALGTGVIATAAAAPIISSSTTASSDAPQPDQSQPLEEVTVTGAAPIAPAITGATVADGLITGAVVATTTAPAVSSSTTPQTQPAKPVVTGSLLTQLESLYKALTKKPSPPSSVVPVGVVDSTADPLADFLKANKWSLLIIASVVVVATSTKKGKKS